MEIELRGKVYFVKNISYGDSCCLGYHHSKGLFNSELVSATFIGNLGDDAIFVREKDGKILSYAGDLLSQVMWYGDGEDDPSFPYVQSEFQGEITGKEADYVRGVLAKAARRAA